MNVFPCEKTLVEVLLKINLEIQITIIKSVENLPNLTYDENFSIYLQNQKMFDDLKTFWEELKVQCSASTSELIFLNFYVN